MCRVIKCPSDYVSVIKCRVIMCRVIKCRYTKNIQGSRFDADLRVIIHMTFKYNLMCNPR